MLMNNPLQLTFSLPLVELAAQLRAQLSVGECRSLAQLLEASSPTSTPDELKTELARAIQEAKLAAQGSLTLPTLDDFLNEL
jgi:hypothetical protein